MQPSKDEMIAALKTANIDIDKAVEQVVVRAYNEYLIEKKKRESTIDKTTDKYVVLLKLVNKILENLGKPQITDVLDFRKIDRLDIIKEVNIQALVSMETEIFKHYDKQKCGYYKAKKKRESYVLNCLRGMCRQIGLVFEYKRRNVIKKAKSITRLLYSISRNIEDNGVAVAPDDIVIDE